MIATTLTAGVQREVSKGFDDSVTVAAADANAIDFAAAVTADEARMTAHFHLLARVASSTLSTTTATTIAAIAIAG